MRCKEQSRQLRNQWLVIHQVVDMHGTAVLQLLIIQCSARPRKKAAQAIFVSHTMQIALEVLECITYDAIPNSRIAGGSHQSQ
jgi:hypothetical protein